MPVQASISKQIKYLEQAVEELVGIPYGMIVREDIPIPELKKKLIQLYNLRLLRNDAVIYVEAPCHTPSK